MAVLGIIKALFALLKSIVSAIKRIVVCIFNLFAGIIKVVKGCIDSIYKLFFIALFSIIGFLVYYVFSNAPIMRQKFNEVKTTLHYIRNISNTLSKTTKNIATFNNKVQQISKQVQQSASAVSQQMKKIF